MNYSLNSIIFIIEKSFNEKNQTHGITLEKLGNICKCDSMWSHASYDGNTSVSNNKSKTLADNSTPFVLATRRARHFRSSKTNTRHSFAGVFRAILVWMQHPGIAETFCTTDYPKYLAVSSSSSTSISTQWSVRLSTRRRIPSIFDIEFGESSVFLPKSCCLFLFGSLFIRDRPKRACNFYFIFIEKLPILIVLQSSWSFFNL